jgi:hypothetical protein
MKNLIIIILLKIKYLFKIIYKLKNNILNDYFYIILLSLLFIIYMELIKYSYKSRIDDFFNNIILWWYYN